jgi:hypothetical protein
VLLLVLILVLIAFGLLLVGFLSSSVLWAWVSVAVSIGAAGVLLFDTLQRRSVVRAGDEAGAEPPADVAEDPTVAAAEPARSAVGSGGARIDMEPATEIIPVFRPSPPMRSGVDPRFDPDADAQQTVMLPAVQPPGSPAGPSGATPGQTPSSESSSPSVTFSKAVPPVPAGGDPSSVAGRPADAEASPEPPSAPEAPTDATPQDSSTQDSSTRDSTPPDSSTGDGTPPDSLTGDSTPPDSSTTPDSATPDSTAVPAGQDAPADRAPSGDGDRTAGSGTAGAALAGAGAAAAVSGPPGQARSPEEPAGRADLGPADVEATTAVSPPPRQEPVSAPADRPVEEPGSLFTSGTATSAAQPGGPDLGAGPPPAASETVDELPSEGAPSQVPADVPEVDREAPEEQSDPEAAALVSGLEDEVLVIDEHPRYHVTGCRSLAAAALIPLPVREAVELGFTPCGWCTPDRSLASRHRATAR